MIMLWPFCPHIAEELSEQCAFPPVFSQKWPEYDSALCADEEIEIVFQVNGKIRGKCLMSADCTGEMMIETAQKDEKTQIWLEGKQIIKTVAVPGKLVNFVVK